MNNGLLTSFVQTRFKEEDHLKLYVFIAGFFLFLTYASSLIINKETINSLSREDGLIENLTAMFFFLTSIFFFVIYFYKKQLIFLALFCVFFIGGGEEISWGQRLLDFNTPKLIAENNIQGEFTFHNLNFFSAQNSKNEFETVFLKFISINFLYKLFWFIYCILLPVILPNSDSVRKIVHKINLPVPPFSIGIFFLINWLIFKITISFIPLADKSGQYYSSMGEIYEFGSASLFMLLSIYFLLIFLRPSKYYLDYHT